MTTRPQPTRTNDSVKDGVKDDAALEPLSEELAARIERLVKRGSKVDVDLAEPIDGDVDL